MVFKELLKFESPVLRSAFDLFTRSYIAPIFLQKTASLTNIDKVTILKIFLSNPFGPPNLMNPIDNITDSARPSPFSKISSPSSSIQTSSTHTAWGELERIIAIIYPADANSKPEFLRYWQDYFESKTTRKETQNQEEEPITTAPEISDSNIDGFERVDLRSKLNINLISTLAVDLFIQDKQFNIINNLICTILSGWKNDFKKQIEDNIQHTSAAMIYAFLSTFTNKEILKKLENLPGYQKAVAMKKQRDPDNSSDSENSQPYLQVYEMADMFAEKACSLRNQAIQEIDATIQSNRLLSVSKAPKNILLSTITKIYMKKESAEYDIAEFMAKGVVLSKVEPIENQYYKEDKTKVLFERSSIGFAPLLPRQILLAIQILLASKIDNTEIFTIANTNLKYMKKNNRKLFINDNLIDTALINLHENDTTTETIISGWLGSQKMSRKDLIKEFQDLKITNTPAYREADMWNSINQLNTDPTSIPTSIDDLITDLIKECKDGIAQAAYTLLLARPEDRLSLGETLGLLNMQEIQSQPQPG